MQIKLNPISFIKRKLGIKCKQELDHELLYTVSTTGNTHVVKKLLKRGADVNALAWRGESALHWALDHYNLDSARLLIENSADIHRRDTYGYKPFYRSVIRGSIQPETSELVNLAGVTFSDIERDISSYAIGLLHESFDKAKVFAQEMSIATLLKSTRANGQPPRKNYHLFEAELLLLLRHPELIDREPNKAHNFTSTITSINGGFSNFVQDAVVKAWADIGHLTFSFPYWLYDTKFREEAVFAKYGFKPIPKRKTDERYGNGYLISNKFCPFTPLLDDKTLIEFRRGYLLATNPNFGTVVIRNSSFVFGRDLLKHVAYFSPNNLSEEDLQTYDPNLDPSLITVLSPEVNQDKTAEKLGFLVDEILRIKEDYKRWKFDSGARQGNNFTGHLSPGFVHIINLIRYLNFIEQSLPDLGFVNPLYPIIQPYRFREQSTGNEVDRYRITEDRIKELADFVEGEWNEKKYRNSDFIEFIKTGIENQGELVMLKGEKI